MEWDPPSPAVWMSGSAARADGTVRSDTDILVPWPDDVDIADEVWAQQFTDFGSDVLAWSGNHCERVEFSESEFADMAAHGERLVAELRRDSIRLAGDTPYERSRRASRWPWHPRPGPRRTSQGRGVPRGGQSRVATGARQRGRLQRGHVGDQRQGRRLPGHDAAHVEW